MYTREPMINGSFATYSTLKALQCLLLMDRGSFEPRNQAFLVVIVLPLSNTRKSGVGKSVKNTSAGHQVFSKNPGPGPRPHTQVPSLWPHTISSGGSERHQCQGTSIVRFHAQNDTRNPQRKKCVQHMDHAILAFLSGTLSPLPLLDH